LFGWAARLVDRLTVALRHGSDCTDPSSLSELRRDKSTRIARMKDENKWLVGTYLESR